MIIYRLGKFNDKDNILLFPNPSNNELNIQIKNEDLSNISFEIYNTLGQLITSSANVSNDVIFYHTLDVSNLADGVYSIKVKKGNETFSKNFIVN